MSDNKGLCGEVPACRHNNFQIQLHASNNNPLLHTTYNTSAQARLAGAKPRTQSIQLKTLRALTRKNGVRSGGWGGRALCGSDSLCVHHPHMYRTKRDVPASRSIWATETGPPLRGGPALTARSGSKERMKDTLQPARWANVFLFWLKTKTTSELSYAELPDGS